MVGGSLLENFAWGAIFLINIPIVIVGLVPTYRVVPESKDPEANPLDPIGALRSVAGLTALVYGIIEVPGLGWTDPTILGSLGAAVVLLGAFLVWERRVAHPMLDFRLLSNPRLTAASPSIALTFFALVGIFFFLTQYLQFVPGFSVLQTGLALVPLVVGGNLPGHEIEYPMAVVILGGLITSTILNLFLLPPIYLAFGKSRRA